MYDVIVIGQGLTGMLSAIWAKEQGYRTALIAAGAGKIVQSSGVMDLIPGSADSLKETKSSFQLESVANSLLDDAAEKFKELTKTIGYPYKGSLSSPVNIVTGAGHIKQTIFYPKSISPVPEQGHVIIVGFQEISDFQPIYAGQNLQKAYPQLKVDVIKIQLGKHSQRTLTQLDAARLLEHEETRSHCLEQITIQMNEKNLSKPDLFVFPASLGMENWQEIVAQFETELGAAITEAVGMPPNATAVRLHNRLKKHAVKLGVRIYSDTTTVGSVIEENRIKAIKIKTSNQVTELQGKQIILATGGILGGGLEVMSAGLKETALGLEVNQFGEIMHCPLNVFPIGASKGTLVTHFGITGGVYSIVSSFETVCTLLQLQEGGTRSA